MGHEFKGNIYIAWLGKKKEMYLNVWGDREIALNIFMDKNNIFVRPTTNFKLKNHPFFK